MNNQLLQSRRSLWIFAGEPSGDVYGAGLARQLRRLRPDLPLQGMGGDEMRRAGVDILVDSSDLAVVGLVEVVKNFHRFFRIFHDLRRRALRQPPAAVVLIDYPGFNLRFARAMRRAGIPVVYYVCPQVWAWGRRRIPRMARDIDKMLALFPFEVEFLAGTGLDVEFVGHPLLEILEAARESETRRDPRTLLILPGSRLNEVRRLLPDMLAAARRLKEGWPELRIVVSLHSETLRPAVELEMQRAAAADSRRLPVELVCGQTRHWLQKAAAGIAASGTVTMEAAILGLPLTVVYRVNPLTYRIARRLVKIPYIAMPNLVAGECVYDELIQGAVTPTAVAESVERILPGGSRVAEVERGMRRVVELLGCGEQAGRKAAQAVLAVARPNLPTADQPD